ncbi:SprB repeat-containing protein, partial [Emticicia sp. W12TSBA100-4]|uniref:SprB repeat-containing protein n=1 Tax=Emticicia sp. W12TSBA100-4 TaxID=3160965 RepID=UPI0033064DBB
VAAPVVVNASCFGTATGSVTLTASGGTSPYQYQQGTGSFVSTNAFTGLAAGTYSFTVQDSKGCSVTTSATVTQPVAALSVAAPVVVNASCFGTATGSVTLTASGGTSPYQYQQGTGSFVSTNA